MSNEFTRNEFNPNGFMNESVKLRTSSTFQSAKNELLQVIQKKTQDIHGIRRGTTDSAAAEAYSELIKSFGKLRGRDLYFPFMGSGLGNGPFVELADGSVKYDMITGIGINFFGHSHPKLMNEIADGIFSDIMQGNLEPSVEMHQVLDAVLKKVGAGSRLKHGWLMCSGTMVNEVALKMIRQKKAPATKIFAFNDCFAGRSTTMQEITDNPSYRQGQPVYGEVHYLPFFDSRLGLEQSIQNTLGVMRTELARFPGKFAALMLEIVQGEGGFQYGPRDFYVRVFEEAKKAGLAIWADEIQTFGRTGELFAYQKFNLNEYVDVVTVGKMLQACLVLYTEEFNPKPGLVAGTFSGSTVALRSARKIMELFDEEKLLGPQGKIQKLSDRFVSNLEGLAGSSCRGLIRETRAIGGMIAFSPFSGSTEDVKKVLFKLFENGVVAFNCGHGPYLVRMLPPLGAMNEAHVDEVCQVIEKSLLELSKEIGIKSQAATAGR